VRQRGHDVGSAARGRGVLDCDFFLLPKPMWIYVFGHELTHALWTWLFGGQVKKMKVTSKGGHVVISKTNFVIALAPYFFPLYVVLVVGVFALGNLIWNWAAISSGFICASARRMRFT
jgi:hypothetical protein